MKRILLVLSLMFALISCSTNPASPETPELPPGLNAEYFLNNDFSGISRTRIDGQVQFNWQATSPVRGLLPSEFSARWQGYLVADKTETVTPSVITNGNSSLYINGQEIAAEQSIDLEAGKRYELKLEYQKQGDDAELELRWLRSDGTSEVIPQKFFVPLANVVTSETVTIGENLLINGDFEGNEGAWLDFGGNAQTQASDLIASNTGFSLSSWAWVQQNIAVSEIEAGLSYTLTAFGKSELGASCKVSMAGGTADSRLFDEKLTFDSVTWQDKELSFELPTGTVWLAVYMTSNNLECHFDELSLVAGDANPAPPPGLPVAVKSPLDNGDFEDGLNRWNLFGGNAALVLGREGTGEAVQVSNFAWLQQDLISARYIPDASYSLSAYGKADAGSCTLGYVAAGSAGALIEEQLVFTSTDWELKTFSFTIPANFAWTAIYLSPADNNCEFDDISLVKQ